MLRGEKIVLRTVREADLDTLYNFWSELPNRGAYYPLDLYSHVDFKKRFHEHGMWEETKGTLLICAAEQILGIISFFNAGYYDGYEIGYILFDTGHRNQGYTTEALTLFVQYLFAAKKINRLQVAVMQGNLPSRRVAEKCGFRFEGLVRGALFHQGQYCDLELFSLLRAEVNIAPKNA